MFKKVSNDDLRLQDIPYQKADWSAIQQFALTFNGYESHDSFEKCAQIANDHRHDTLTNLRICLFFEQRRWRHFGEEPDEDSMAYIRAVLNKIRHKVEMEVTWNKAKENVGALEVVRELIEVGRKERRGGREMQYSITLHGNQRRASTRGEGVVETQLLSTCKKPKECILLKDEKKIKSVYFTDNAVGIGARQKGNIIVDLFGLDDRDSPVCGEVKITANNPWSAVVQCVEQVALLRSDRAFLRNNLRTKAQKDIRGVGAWGLVIAPPKYWDKKEFHAAKRLVEYLRSKTMVRICCVSYPKLLNEGQVFLNVICGLPPYARL